MLADDAAISFRYVERLVAGRGFTYNDHEAVQGASNPLWVLLLAACHALGADIESAAEALSALLYVTSVLLAAGLTSRLSSPWLGWLGGLALACEGFYRVQSLCGMESVLAANLGLLAILLACQGREGWAGAVLGLALVNKLDAGPLVLALAAGWLLVHRRLPSSMLLAAAATAAPWFAFAAATYGSLVPNSMMIKLQHHFVNFDPLWIAKFFLGARRYWFLAPIAVQLASLWRATPSQRLGTLALSLWFALHALAFSLLDLGDAYPWYLTVLMPPWAILAAAWLHAGLRLFGPRSPIGYALLAAVAPLFAIPVHLLARDSTFAPWRAGNPLASWEAFYLDRHLAGALIDELAGPEEAVASGWGWVAFSSRRPHDDLSRLNSRQLLGETAYRVDHGMPYTSGWNPPPVPEGMQAVAILDLASDLFPGYSWFMVFARPDSAIARHGIRYLKLRLPEFPPPEPLSPGVELARVVAPDGDLVSALPGGAEFRMAGIRERPLHLVFTPEVAAEDSASAVGADVELRVELDDEVVYLQLLRQRGEPALVRLPVGSDDFRLGFRASGGIPGQARIRWRGVKLVRGEQPALLARIRSPELRQAWCRFNPCPAGAAGGSQRAISSRWSPP